MRRTLKITLVLGGIIVTAILTILPITVHQRTCFSGSSCVALLRSIDGAKATWAFEHGKTTNDTPRDSDLFGPNAYIREKPICPSGAIYILGKVGERARCSLPMHSSDFGWVIVADDTGAPIDGAEVGVIGNVTGAESCLTDTNGVGRVTLFPASVVGEWSQHAVGIRASHSDFLTTTSAFPCPWPVRITLRPKPR